MIELNKVYGQCPHGNNYTTCFECIWLEAESTKDKKLDDCSHKDWHSDCVHCNFYKVGLDIYKPRLLKSLTEAEITHINDILKDESRHTFPFSRYDEIAYRCFTKTRAIYSGIGIVKVHEYLKSININVLEHKDHDLYKYL